MLLTSVLGAHTDNHYETIQRECSEFIKCSDGLPVFKNLSKQYDNIHRVKVRHKKTSDRVAKTFNEAFHDKMPNMSQRAIFANGRESFKPSDNHDSFYVFPINGFKYLYSKEVSNSSKDYKAVIDSVLETFDGNVAKASSIVAEVIRYSYVSDPLKEGIEQGSEIIFLDIPYYYAVRSSTIEYNELLSSV